jgi:hypothetical protein
MFSTVEKHSKILYRLQEDLPPEMQPSEPEKESASIFSKPQRRSLILLHIIILGALMLVQRRLLVAMAECGIKRRWTLDGEPEQGARVQLQCVEAAETCIHLLHLLACTRYTFRRWWLCMYVKISIVG